MIKEITAKELNADNFISTQVEEIKAKVGGGIAINALSGGVDSGTIVSLMKKFSPSPIKTFSVGFEQEEHTETNEVCSGCKCKLDSIPWWNSSSGQDFEGYPGDFNSLHVFYSLLVVVAEHVIVIFLVPR